jgi:hypothetical protein
MSYIIRDDKGIMIAKISNSIANNFFNNSLGSFKKFFTNYGIGKICFIVKEARYISIIQNGEELIIYVWEDYILEPN